MTGESYTAEEYELGYPGGIEHHFWNVARNDALLRELRWLNDSDGLIVDVGCGTGITTRFLHDRGFNIRGVEKGDAPVDPASRAFISTGCDLFDMAPEQKNRVTSVLLLDVIEHMAARVEFLKELRRQLPNCRHLLLTVPARRELWSEFDSAWGHHLRYDRGALAAELNAAGFEVRKMSYRFHALYLAGLLLRLLRVKRGKAFSSPLRSRPVRLLHRLAGMYGKLENRVVPGFVVGSSLLCVATRKP